MVRPSRLIEERKSPTLDDTADWIKVGREKLVQLVTKNASKTNLRLGVVVYKTLSDIEQMSDLYTTYLEILKGDNKHKFNFYDEERKSPRKK